MKIDMFTHILPPRYRDAIMKHASQNVVQVTALWDMEQRFRIMDKFDDYVQVLTFSAQPIEAIVDPRHAVELARFGNDELAEMLVKHPDRFVAGVAILPNSDIDARLKEAERATKALGLKGVLLCTNINGKPLDLPEFMPLYEMMARYDLPIWIHPHREQRVADYSTESESKYRLYGAIGWPYETEVAMSRLVCSGVLEKYPNLKFITHHCGGGMPFLGNRIAHWISPFMKEEPNTKLRRFSKQPIEYLRLFYGDTAIGGSTPALECGCAFFGAERVVFGTDMPFGFDGGEGFVREAVEAVMAMDITDADKKKIFEDNARKLLRLPV